VIVLPGYCRGDLEPLESQMGCRVVRGPRDLRALPEWFGTAGRAPDLDRWDIEIIAEINHAPQMSLTEIVAEAGRLQASGADYIDLGCDPGGQWLGVGDAVKAVLDLGCRVSVDSLNVAEISQATQAGATLVLSVNHSNRAAALDWGVPVVVIPDQPSDWRSLEVSVEYLENNKVPFRIDPILEPIGFGFAESLGRYLAARRQWPAAEMMMGVGNLTELTDVDSAGVNLLLSGFCQEVGIRSVLTTQVINWAHTSVRELSIARRLVHHSIHHRVPPKRLSNELVTLRDAKVRSLDHQVLRQMSEQIKDWNFRIFVVERQLVCLGGGHYWVAEDPFELFDQIAAASPPNLDPSHSFYLGYEMAKALTAAQLGKQYQQDQALDWGYLTVSEADRHRLKKRTRKRRGPGESLEG
jgi:dihydropteroate synthase-like protein